MTREPFTPTDEQRDIIHHEGSAFVSACPGAGKTQVMVERARILLSQKGSRGLAFLSFSKDAVSELSERLRREGLLAEPRFPHFVGTFDSFLFQFFVAPFGIPGYSGKVRLIPDKGERKVRPFPNARPLSLSCFDPISCQPVAEVMKKEHGFDPDDKPSLTERYVEAARRLRGSFQEKGFLDFAEVRMHTAKRLEQSVFRQRLGKALSGRFREVIVDEAQDCNPEDLRIVRWIVETGIPTKIICDPQQSIFGFRGADASQLTTYRDSFAPEHRLTLTGNFRSSQLICAAVAAFRRGDHPPDLARGKFRDANTEVQGSELPGKKGHGGYWRPFSWPTRRSWS